MGDPKRSVLQVLPYPGGGGETYVDQLARIDAYRFEKTFIAPGPTHIRAVLTGGIRAQMYSRRSDLLHVHGEVAAALCLPTLALRPSVLTLHGLHLVLRLDGRKRALAVANLRALVRAASKTICVSDDELSAVESLVRTPERLVLIHNGIDLPIRPSGEERAAARTELGIPQKEVVALFLAALDPHKEPITVANAAMRLARKGLPLVALFAGDGPLRGRLEALASDSDALKILGFQSDVRRVFAAADLFVLTSRREGLSFSLLEAMSLGLAPIVSDAPGNPEAVGEAGIVVRGGEPAALQGALERLVLDAGERARLGERARHRVADHFSAAQMLERTRAVYDDVLGVAR